VSPRVVSRLAPAAFSDFMTKPAHNLSLPRIVFAELGLGSLGKDPAGAGHDLPYRNMQQLRYCLHELLGRPDKVTKIVDRELQRDLPYWMIQGGIYAGDQTELGFFRMPTEDELRETNFAWWSSARAVELL
jgi:hypothetical protein